MNFKVSNCAPRPALIRRAIEPQRRWIEAQIGISLSEAVLVESRLNLAQIGVEKVLGHMQDPANTSRAIGRLRSFVATAQMPSGMPPLIVFRRGQASRDFLGALIETPTSTRVEWQDCPVALTLHTIKSPVVALNVYYFSGPAADHESMTSVLIARRESIDQVMRLIEALDARESQPRLHVHQSQSRLVPHCDWDDLVLDPSIVSLLKNDYESFWGRQSWFREHHLPFRRGYLLHGPPGNGKSTAIRAMMSSRSLSAFTIRLFDPRTTDYDLDDTFEEALTERPAMVLLEDLDRAFPRSGDSRSQVSLQSLLNSLDGVASGEGIVVVATANEPAALDPAILRRPGRFDRVVHFPSPDRLLRQEYLSKLNPHLDVRTLEPIADEASGFSFAQLRESVILAAQFAFEGNEEVSAKDLLSGVQTLRRTMMQSSNHSTSAGFVPLAQPGGGA